MKLSLFFILCFCVISPSWAQSETPLPTQKEFEWSIGRDPAAAYAFIEKQYHALTVTTPDIRRIRISNFLMIAASQLEKTDLVLADLAKIKDDWQRAGKLKMIEDRLSLGQTLAMITHTANQLAESEQLFKITIAEARQYQQPSFLMQVLANYGQILSYTARMPQALPYLHEAQVLADDAKLDIDPMFRHAVRMSIVLSIESEDFKSVFDLFEDSLKFFQANKLESYVSIFSFNAAMSYKTRKVSDYEKARHFYQMALDSSKVIHDRSTEGATLSELAGIDVVQGRPKEGLQKALEAIAVIGNTDDRWLGRALSQKAQAEFALGQYDSALIDLEKALAMISEEFVEQRGVLFTRKSEVLEKLQRWPEALIALRIARELQEKANEGRQENSFAKASVQLGLQMEEQKNTILQKENELQAAKIQAGKRVLLAVWALGILLVTAIGFMVWALYNARRIARANARIRNILDIIEEGILTIDSGMALEPFHSPYLKKLYPQLSRATGDAVDLLFAAEAIGEQAHSMVRETLRAILGEEMLAWELNEAHLPDEIEWKGESSRVIHILWQPILGADQKIRAVLLSLRDVTEERQLEQEIAVQIKTAAANQERTHELLLTKIPDVIQLLERLEIILLTPEEPLLILRKLHTAKGEARSLGLKNLSDCIHRIEGELQTTDPINWSPLRKEINAYGHIIRDVFPQGASASRAQSLTEVVGGLLPGLKALLKNAQLHFGTIEIVESVEHWPDSVLEAARQCLVHALANSADHGYILAGNSTPPRFQIEAHQQTTRFTIILRDFGSGLNRSRLEQLAAERNFTPNDPEHWADVVFLDGASTALTTTKTSGRGVGLSAVRELCLKSGGEAHFLANDRGPGSRLVMDFGDL